MITVFAKHAYHDAGSGAVSAGCGREVGGRIVYSVCGAFAARAIACSSFARTIAHSINRKSFRSLLKRRLTEVSCSVFRNARFKAAAIQSAEDACANFQPIPSEADVGRLQKPAHWPLAPLLMCTALICPFARAADLDLSVYRGKVVYIDFWASWCAPCRESFPWLDELLREYTSKNLVIIGVNVDKDHDRAQRFLNETRADFPIIYDPEGELATAYRVAGMPSGILIDRGGHIRFQHAGFSVKQKELYEHQLQTLLAERTP